MKSYFYGFKFLVFLSVPFTNRQILSNHTNTLFLSFSLTHTFPNEILKIKIIGIKD